MQTSDQLTLFRPEGKEHDEIPHVTMRFMYYHVFVAHGVVCVCDGVAFKSSIHRKMPTKVLTSAWRRQNSCRARCPARKTGVHGNSLQRQTEGILRFTMSSIVHVKSI